jgi:hypothetical protein
VGWGAPPPVGLDGPLPPPGGVWNQGPINYWGFYFFGIWIPL